MLTFPEAISESASLIHQLEEDPQRDVKEKLSEILQSSEGARGFLVSLLTENWRFGDHIPSKLIGGIKEAKHITFDLLVKNLVMSTTMRLTHERNRNHEQAQGSIRVARRTKYIISNIKDADLQDCLSSMRNAVQTRLEDLMVQAGSTGVQSDTVEKEKEFVSFLEKWKYDQEQLNAANDALNATIN